jgi:hypothetical protein
MAKGGKAKKGVRKVSDDPIGDFLNDYEIEKLTKGMAELDAKIKDLEPVPTQVETGSDPMLLDVYPRLKREMEADPHLYEYGTANKKDPSFRRPMLRKPAGRPDDVIPDRLDNDWLEYQLRPRGQTDFSDKLPPGIELPIGKVRSLLEDPSEYYAKGGEVSGPKGFGLADVAPFVSPMSMKTGGSVMDKPQQDMMDPDYRKQLERDQALEASPFGPEDLIGLGLGKKALNAAEFATRPYVKNRVVLMEHSDDLKLPSFPVRMPKSSADITHAYRTLSPKEYEAAKKSGYFERNPNPIYPPADAKWWSGGDEAGKFGRNWSRGKDAIVVRVPMDKVPTRKAVRFKDVEKMKTGGEARTRAGTIAKPTFIDEQLGRTSERLSKLATNPEQAMRDIAAQYFPSPTESPEEQQRKLEELALGFTGNIKPVGGATNKIFYRGSTVDEKVLRPSSGHEHGVSGISTSPNKEFAGKHGKYIKSYSAKPGEFVDFFDLVKMYNKSFGEDAFLDATDKSVTEFAKSKGYIGSRFNDPFGGEDYRFFDTSSLKPVKSDTTKAQGGLAHMSGAGKKKGGLAHI